MSLSISVVIPVYRSPYVADAMRSILVQSVRPDEIIIVDGSPEFNSGPLKPFEGSFIHLIQPPRGVSAARNIGIRAAKGEFVAFLDADDFWLPDKIKDQIDAFRRFPQSGFSFSTVWNYCAPECENIPSDPFMPAELVSWLETQGHNHETVHGSVYDLLLAVNCVATSSVIARRSALFDVGLFDESLNNGEDYELWLRLARSYSAAVIRYPTSRYRVHGGGLSGSWESRSRLFYQYNMSVLEYHAAKFPSPAVRKALARTSAAYAYFLLCRGERETAAQMARQSITLCPNFTAVRTLLEARYPKTHSWLARRLRQAVTSKSR